MVLRISCIHVGHCTPLHNNCRSNTTSSVSMLQQHVVSSCRHVCNPSATHVHLKPTQRHRACRHRALVCRSQHNFVLYTKPECPLCDGLKDKVQGLIDRAQFMPCFLTGSTLEVRDISTNEAWQDAMHLSVPVLALLDEQRNEVVLPRPQPRISADRLQRHLEEAIKAAAGVQQ